MIIDREEVISRIIEELTDVDNETLEEIYNDIMGTSRVEYQDSDEFEVS